MLAKEGFNVLLVDQRDTGNSTCVDGRHSVGQDESDDFARVAQWLVAEKGITPDKIGMFGVSGGAIATAILPAKTDNVTAFAMEAPIFDFAETVRRELEFQGFPSFVWTLANTAAMIRGVDLNETPITAGIDSAGNRPMLLTLREIDPCSSCTEPMTDVSPMRVRSSSVTTPKMQVWRLPSRRSRVPSTLRECCPKPSDTSVL
jgi:pimeloyl-ACP methyl ester carboxylesterase